MGIAIRKAKKLAFGMGISQSEANKAEAYETVEEESNFFTAEADGDSEKSAAEVTEDGSF